VGRCKLLAARGMRGASCARGSKACDAPVVEAAEATSSAFEELCLSRG